MAAKVIERAPRIYGYMAPVRALEELILSWQAAGSA
jgi:hypothetical protein